MRGGSKKKKTARGGGGGGVRAGGKGGCLTLNELYGAESDPSAYRISGP